MLSYTKDDKKKSTVIYRDVIKGALAMTLTICIYGIFGYLGLIIANLARQLFKTHKHSYLILGSAMMGMFAMIAGQVVSQHVFSYAVPMSTFITIGGGMYFLYLLLFKKGGIG